MEYIMALVFDIEANGLLDEATEVFVIVCYNDITEETDIYTHDRIPDGVRVLKEADSIVAHNAIGYDIPLLKKLYDIDLYDKCEDTYILSQMFFPNEMRRHGIKAWGERFGDHKIEHEDWTQYSDAMRDRCVKDVEILARLWKFCKRELNSWDWEFSKRVEYLTYKWFCKNQTKWRVDKPLMERYIQELDIIIKTNDDKLISLAPLNIKKSGKVIQPFKKDGGYKVLMEKKWGEDIFNVWGEYCQVDIECINLNSSTQLVKWLISVGWRPEELTPAGNPKMSDSKFIGVDPIIRPSLTLRNQASHRRGLLKGFVKKVDKDDNLNTFAFTCGTNTARFKHNNVVNIPKADEDIFYGKEMRSVFITEPGYVLVGCDASALEARIEGHTTYEYDEGKYARFLLEQDIHTFNAEALGIDRNSAKEVGYAMSYQCRWKKIKSLLDCSDDRAQRIYKRYWRDRPAVRAVIEKLEKYVEFKGFVKKKRGYKSLDITKRPYIEGIDGRKIYVRSMHSLKNAYIQNAGTIAMKIGYIKLAAEIAKAKLDARIVMFYHDEYQIMCRPEDADRICKMAEDAIKYGGERLELHIPLAGESGVGNSWAETH